VRKVADNRIEFTISGEDMDYAKGRVRLADGSKSGLQS
jgi:hypothetical protein